MESLDFAAVQCPYCGETIELAVDASAGEQRYIEDCSVCCKPIEVLLFADGGDWRIAVARDDD